MKKICWTKLLKFRLGAENFDLVPKILSTENFVRWNFVRYGSTRSAQRRGSMDDSFHLPNSPNMAVKSLDVTGIHGITGVYICSYSKFYV